MERQRGVYDTVKISLLGNLSTYVWLSSHFKKVTRERILPKTNPCFLHQNIVQQSSLLAFREKKTSITGFPRSTRENGIENQKISAEENQPYYTDAVCVRITMVGESLLFQVTPCFFSLHVAQAAVTLILLFSWLLSFLFFSSELLLYCSLLNFRTVWALAFSFALNSSPPEKNVSISPSFVIFLFDLTWWWCCNK